MIFPLWPFRLYKIVNNKKAKRKPTNVAYLVFNSHVQESLLCKMGGIWKGDKTISVHVVTVYNAPSANQFECLTFQRNVS